MRLFQSDIGIYRSAWEMLNSANGIAEQILRTTQVLNIFLANIFQHRQPMRNIERDQLIQSVVNINLLLEMLALDLDYEEIRALRQNLIRCRARNEQLCQRFLALDLRVQEGLNVLEGYQTEFARIWGQVHGGRLNDRLYGDIHIRSVRRSNHGFLILD